MEHTSKDQDRRDDRLKTAPNGHRPPTDLRSENTDRQNDGPKPSPTVRRVTVPEAAEILSITTDAVRSRMRRGKLRREEGDHGTVYVLLDAQEDPDGQDGHPTVENGEKTGNPTGGNGRETVEDGLLVGELRDRVRSLETQLDHERQANRENRRLLAAALERIPEIPAPDLVPEARESTVPPSEEPGKDDDVPPGPQEHVQRRSWLHRFFFGP